MIRSGNELTGLVHKAARGAGLPLGIAEDLAAAAPRLGTFNLAVLCSALVDPGRHADLVALCHAADAERCGQVPTIPASCASLSAALMADPDAISAIGPRDVRDDLWTSLERLARATLVPASDASRASGAGAELDDND